jgi:hypothetical protein
MSLERMSCPLCERPLPEGDSGHEIWHRWTAVSARAEAGDQAEALGNDVWAELIDLDTLKRSMFATIDQAGELNAEERVRIAVGIDEATREIRDRVQSFQRYLARADPR